LILSLAAAKIQISGQKTKGFPQKCIYPDCHKRKNSLQADAQNSRKSHHSLVGDEIREF
jgi:hypothetical protein